MLLTIFTPTYNRRELLKRAYESLCRQSQLDFQWLIVDDGSDDDTAALVEIWQQKAKFPIKYYYQVNQGKMQAHNLGVQHTDTELFVCLDSDDYLVDDAVEKIYDRWKWLAKKENLNHLAGMIAYKGKNKQSTMNGEVFPQKEKITLSDLYKHGFKGETMLIHKTSVLREFPFPVFPKETFIPESVVFDKIDKKYSLFIVPEILMVCEYQPDGLTNSIGALRRNNPNGWLYYYQSRIKDTESSCLRYKYIAHAICFSWLLKKNIFLSIPASRKDVFICIPAAILLRLMGKL